MSSLSALVLPEIRAEITLGRDVLAYFDHLMIEQYHDQFHKFTIVIDHDVLESPRSYNPEKSKEYIGEILNVTLKQSNSSGPENYFKGIVTSVRIKQNEGYHGKLVLEGYSPDFLLDGQSHRQCFYEESIGDIVDKLSHSLKSVQTKIDVRPKNTGGVLYACQCGETNYAFLQRLAADLGEWFFYDGKKLFFGKPKDEDPIPMIYGRDSEKMSMSMKLKPLSFGRYGYDAASDTFSSYKAPKDLKGIGNFGDLALNRAKKLFKEESLAPASFLQVEGEQTVQRRLERQSADLFILEGESGNHLLHPGAVIEMKFSVKGEKSFEHRPSGQYRIIESIHQLDAKGHYKNSFKAIPADTAMLPQEHVKRIKAEPQLAVVTDNNDPEGLGQVRVKFLWQDGDVSTPFIRVLRPDFGSDEQSGKNRGYFWVPEIGDQVLVQFFDGMPEQPYVAGAFGHGKNKSSGHLKNNHLKSISTRSGHTIEFNDADGGTSIIIRDHAGNEIHLDTIGKNITVSAPETMTFNAKNVIVNAEENMVVNAGQNISQSAQMDISQSAGEHMSQYAGKDFKTVAVNITQIASESTEYQSKSIEKTSDEMAVASNKEKVKLNAKGTVELKSAQKSKLF